MVRTQQFGESSEHVYNLDRDKYCPIFALCLGKISTRLSFFKHLNQVLVSDKLMKTQHLGTRTFLPLSFKSLLIL